MQRGDYRSTCFRRVALRRDPPAYEMDDLEAVTGAHWSNRPTVAGHNFTIEFHGHAILFHAELLHQLCEVHSGKLAFFSIDGECHSRFVVPGSALLYASNLRKRNLRVAVRPEWLACTSTEESGKEASLASIFISALPEESVITWV